MPSDRPASPGLTLISGFPRTTSHETRYGCGLGDCLGGAVRTGCGRLRTGSRALPPQYLRSGARRDHSVGAHPDPEGPVGPGFERTPTTENSKPLSLIERFIPDPLPAPLAQAFCGGGGDLVVTFADGQQLTYGPCHRPASIDHLWAEMIYVLDDGKCSPRCGPGGAARLIGDESFSRTCERRAQWHRSARHHMPATARRRAIR